LMTSELCGFCRWLLNYVNYVDFVNYVYEL
jgi:hypothetical protein